MKAKWVRRIAVLAIGLFILRGAGSASVANAADFLVLTGAQADAADMPALRPTALPFTVGNLVVYRVGDGIGSLAVTGNPVFLDEYSLAGTVIQSIPMPTTVSGANKQLIANGTATSEGLLTRSVDGQYLLLTGYAASIPYPTSVSTATASAVNRVVGRVDRSGDVDTSTALNDFASGSNPRSAASTNGTGIWITGGAGGVRYSTIGSTTSTQLSTSPTNLRQVNIFGGQLYASANTTTFHLTTVGTGLPTTSPQTISNLPGFPTTGSQYGFFFADLDGTPGVDTVYVASDDAGGLQKYSLVGGNWTSNGLIGGATDAYRGLTGEIFGTTVNLYATRKGSELVWLQDASGYNAALSGTPSLIATAATNTAFRGVAFAPISPVCGAFSNGNWSNTAVWDCGRVPGAGDSVIIASGRTVTLDTNTASLKNVTIGGTLTTDGSPLNLSLTGDWTKTGTFTPGTSTVTFNGTASSSAIQTLTGITTFNNLTINAGSIVNADDSTLTVNGTLTNNGQLRRTPGSSIACPAGETDATGHATIALNNCSAPGTAVRIRTSAGKGFPGADLPGNTRYGDCKGASNLVNRFWDISPDGSLTADVTFSYRSTELNGIDPAHISVYKCEGSTWTSVANDRPSTNLGDGYYSVTALSVPIGSGFALGGASAPNAVTLSSLAAHDNGSAGLPIWLGVISWIGILSIIGIAGLYRKRPTQSKN